MQWPTNTGRRVLVDGFEGGGARMANRNGWSTINGVGTLKEQQLFESTTSVTAAAFAPSSST